MTTLGRMSRAEAREKKLIWEMDTYASKFNAVLKDNPLVQHLLPIERGSDDLAHKVKDGLLLSAFINQIPGYKNIINVSKLHTVEKMPDGSWEKLNMFQLAQNQDQMLQAARFIGINVENIGVLDIIEGQKNIDLVNKLCAEINNFESMELIAMSAADNFPSNADSDSESQLNSIQNVSSLRKSRRMERLEGKSNEVDSHVENEKVIRDWINGRLAEIGVRDRIGPKESLSSALNDSRIYLMILNHLDPGNCPIDAIEAKDLQERARSAIQNAKAFGVLVFIQDYDLVFGENPIHFQFCAGIIAASAKRASVSENRKGGAAVAVGNLARHTSSLSDLESSEVRLPVVLDDAEEYEEEIEVEEYVQEEVDASESRTSSGPSLVSLEAPLPVKAGKKNADEYEVIGNSDSFNDLEGGITVEADDLDDSISKSESIAFAKASRDMRLKDKRARKSNYLGGSVKTKEGRDWKLIASISCIMLFFLFLFLSIFAYRLVSSSDGSSSTLSSFLPITTDLTQLQGRTSTVKYHLYNYPNLQEVLADSSAKLKVETVGPFEYTRSQKVYNVTFLQNNGADVVRFMRRSEYTPTSATTDLLASTTVITPAQKYISAIGSSFLNDFILRGESALTLLHSYLDDTLTPILVTMLVPAYFQNIEHVMGNAFLPQMKNWGDQQTVTFGAFRQVHPLGSSVNAQAIEYLFGDNLYAINKYTATTEGILAYADSSGNLDGTIATDMMNSVSIGDTDAMNAISAIRNFISTVRNDPTFLETIKDELRRINVLGNTENLSALKDIGLLQFAQGSIVSLVTNGSSTSAFDNTDLFGPMAFNGIPELSVFLSRYYSISGGITLAQSRAFLSNFQDFLTLGSFFASEEYGFDVTSNTGFTATGANAANIKGFAAFLKHVLKFDYLNSINLANARTIPPTSLNDAGLFVQQSAADFINGFKDPNDPNGNVIQQLNLVPEVLSNNFATDEAHWVANPYDYIIETTGTDNVSNVFQLQQYDGRTRILGIWADSSVRVSGYDTFGVTPRSADSPLSSFDIWEEIIQRPLQFSLSGESNTIAGASTRRYFIPDAVFASLTTNTANSVFLMNGPDGLMNLAPFSFGAPVWISRPEFSGSSASATDFFDPTSFTSSKSTLESFMDIEPSTGLTYQAVFRWQYNLKVESRDYVTEPGYANLFDGRDEIYLPLYWQEEVYSIDTSDSTQASTFLNPSEGDDKSDTVLALTVVFAVLALFFLILAIYFLYIRRKEQQSQVQVRPGLVNLH